MTPEGGRPIDHFLFEAVQAHSMRTRGKRANRVTMEYSDGTSATFQAPGAGDLSSSAHPASANEPPWPPDDGWGFRAGEVSFNGTRFKLSGKMLLLLRELAQANGNPVSADKLKRAVWHEDPDLIEDGNLHGHVSALRKKLRESLGLERSFDPIPHADGAYRLVVH